MDIDIGGFVLGRDRRTFVIAELSANHNLQYELAEKTIVAAHEAGADAVKLQTYTPDTITLDCDNDYFKIKQGTIWDGTTLHRLYEKAYTPWEWQQKLFRLARELGLVCFSSVFDPTAVDFLESLDPSAYKIASFEITDMPLIEYVAARGRPVLISTGIATREEIKEAVSACRRRGNRQVILLKCTSSYPARAEDANLLTIPDMARAFRVPVGLSDHTLDPAVAVAAVALGACVVEKHLILDRKLGGPDAAFSLEPAEFRSLVDSIRTAEKALGRIDYSLDERRRKNREFSRSLFVARDVKRGERFTTENVRSVRPGFGLLPKYLPRIIGKKAKRDLAAGTPLTWDAIG